MITHTYAFLVLACSCQLRVQAAHGQLGTSPPLPGWPSTSGDMSPAGSGGGMAVVSSGGGIVAASTGGGMTAASSGGGMADTVVTGRAM